MTNNSWSGNPQELQQLSATLRLSKRTRKQQTK